MVNTKGIMDPENTINASLDLLKELPEKRIEFINHVRKWTSKRIIEYNLLDYILEDPDRVLNSPSFLLSQELPYILDKTPNTSLAKIKAIIEPMIFLFFEDKKQFENFINRTNFFGLLGYNETIVGISTIDFLTNLFERCSIVTNSSSREYLELLSIIIMVFREIYEFRGKEELETFHKTFGILKETDPEVEVRGVEGVGGTQGVGGVKVTKEKKNVKIGETKEGGNKEGEEGIDGDEYEGPNIGEFTEEVEGEEEDFIQRNPDVHRRAAISERRAPQSGYNGQRQQLALIKFNLEVTILISKLSDYNELVDEWIVSRDRTGDTTDMENLRREIINDYEKLKRRKEKHKKFTVDLQKSEKIFNTLNGAFLNTFPEYTDEWYDKKYISKING